MTINENKKFSRNRKRRITRKINMDNNMKLLLIKIKSEKKKKNKEKIKNLEIELVKIKNAKNPNKLQPELKKLNKIQVVKKKFT